MQVISSTSEALTPTCIALGNFDGVHRGHQQVIAPAVAQAQALSSVSTSGECDPPPSATVVTFDPHPRAFFSGQAQPLLTPLAEKQCVLARLGVKQLVLLPFNQDLASLPPAEFVETLLVQQLDAKFISVGQDFAFGRDRTGTVQDLQAIAHQHGIEVYIAPLCREENVRISSSGIRAALSEAKLDTANLLLGRAYRLRGEVIHGQKLGRTIGFPTANLALETHKFLPHSGVYAVQVRSLAFQGSKAGVLNIGCRPTVSDAAATPSVEVHLLDHRQDLYGAILNVDLRHYLRPEHKFASLDALRKQIMEDITLAQSFLFAYQPLP